MGSSASTPSREDCARSVESGVAHLLESTRRETSSLCAELRAECVPDLSSAGSSLTRESALKAWKTFRSYLHVPYFPAFHQPGWLLRYMVGPYDAWWVENIFADIWAGITVAMLLIPQALSYATLANLPPVNGLYCAVLPSAVYSFFGSSLQLAVGPVAIVSLIMGSLVSQYGIVAGSVESVEFASEVCLCMGSILVVLSILNVGNFIRYISFPVMSGFTSAAAALIGLNQMKNMFGFTYPGVNPATGLGSGYFPQTGDLAVESNYEVMEWIVHHWYDTMTYAPTPAPTGFGVPTATPSAIAPTPAPTKALQPDAIAGFGKKFKIVLGEGKQILNPYAIAICFGLWAALAVINTTKKRFKPTPERKKSWCFYVWSMLANVSPFFAIIIGAGIAASLKQADDYDNWYVKCDTTPTTQYGLSHGSASGTAQCPADSVFTLPGTTYAICGLQTAAGATSSTCQSSGGFGSTDYQANPNIVGSTGADCFWYLKYDCAQPDTWTHNNYPSGKTWLYQANGVTQTNMRRWAIDASDSRNWHHNFYKNNLKIVGDVAPGLNILRTPTIKWDFGKLLLDVIPLTLIAFMESYSVARKMAALRNELNILNASQELWSVGVANLLGAVSSAYPVAGSFSRSSLNLASGARTPVSKLICMCVILLTLGVLTSTFYYIPQAALAAVIMASISSLVDLRDFWNAWKYSKKDFFLMLWTTAITFIFDTKWGLLAGIGMSVFYYLAEVAFVGGTAPQKLYSNHSENDGVEVVSLESDLVFLNSARVKDFLTSLITLPTPDLDRDKTGRSEYIFHTVSTAFDRAIQPNLIKSVNTVLPSAVVIDMRCVHIVDMTGLQALAEFIQSARKVDVFVVIINTAPIVTESLIKFGVKSDGSKPGLDLDQYSDLSNLPVLRHTKEAYESVKQDDGALPSKGPEFRETAATAFAASRIVSDGTEDIERPAKTTTDDEWEEVNGGRVRKATHGLLAEDTRRPSFKATGRPSQRGSASAMLDDERSIELSSASFDAAAANEVVVSVEDAAGSGI